MTHVGLHYSQSININQFSHQLNTLSVRERCYYGAWANSGYRSEKSFHLLIGSNLSTEVTEVVMEIPCATAAWEPAWIHQKLRYTCEEDIYIYIRVYRRDCSLNACAYIPTARKDGAYETGYN